MKISIISSLAIIATISLAACGGANTGSDSQEATSSHGGEEITLEKYKSTIAEDKVTMVDFYTTWCGPCKRMAPDVV